MSRSKLQTTLETSPCSKVLLDSSEDIVLKRRAGGREVERTPCSKVLLVFL